MKRLADIIIEKRVLFLVLLAAATLFFLYQINNRAHGEDVL